MKRQINRQLSELQTKLDSMHEQLIIEESICAAELRARTAKGLTGSAAVEHYNQWMKRHGLTYMCVET